MDEALNRLNRVRDLEDPARGFFRIGIETGGGVLHLTCLTAAKEILAGNYLPGFNDFAVSKCFCNVSIWPEA